MSRLDDAERSVRRVFVSIAPWMALMMYGCAMWRLLLGDWVVAALDIFVATTWVFMPSVWPEPK